MHRIGTRLSNLVKRRPLQEAIAHGKKIRDKSPVRPIQAAQKVIHGARQRYGQAKQSLRNLRH